MKIFLLLFPTFVLLCSCQEKDSFKHSLKTVEDVTIVKEYTNPKQFMGEAYCYYVYQEIIKPVKITPQLFSRFIKGGTLSLSFLADYNRWLKNEKGALCKQIIGSDFRPIENDLGKKYIIFINITAIKDEGKNPNITFNHERLHVAFSLYKEKRNRVEALWNSLSEVDKNKFIHSHPGYNFSNPDVQLREYFAYKFQNHYKNGIKLLIK
jgi:hypothetical protein